MEEASVTVLWRTTKWHKKENLVRFWFKEIENWWLDIKKLVGCDFGDDGKPRSSKHVDKPVLAV